MGIAEKRAERSIERVPAGVGSRLAEDWFVDPATRRPGYAPDPLQIDPVGLEPIVPSVPEIAPLSLLFGGVPDEEGRLGWQDEALCAQTDPEAFFPEKGGSTREAKRVCATCDVRSECLEYALQNDERFGIWGGLSERERRKLKKRVV